MIAPVIRGWIEQKYGYLPGVAKVSEWRSFVSSTGGRKPLVAAHDLIRDGRPRCRSVSPHDTIAREVLSSHARSLMPNHLTDVASNDQHNVKPLFDGRLDYSPPGYGLASHGVPLVSGRLDYVNNRPVALLVYQRRKHVINLFVWPTDAANRHAPEITRQGYHLLSWTRAGVTDWAVSGLNGDERREFARLRQQLDSLAASRENGQ